MNLFIANSTSRMSGGQRTTMLIDQFVNARLGSYGPAVETVVVRLLYPTRPRAAASLDRWDFQKRLEQCPRVRFFRAKARVEIWQICRGVNPRTMIGNGHLTFKEVESLTATVAKVLELIRPRFRPADNFDCDQFLADARQALAECPQAIRPLIA